MSLRGTIILLLIFFIGCSSGNQSTTDDPVAVSDPAGEAEPEADEEDDTSEPEIFSDTVEANATTFEDPYAGADLIPVYGRYSKVYESDWSILETGKEIAKKDLSQIQFNSVLIKSAESPYVYTQQPTLELKNLFLEVDWDATASDYWNTSLIVIDGVDEVVIDGVYIRQKNTSYIGYNTILVNDCKNVTIRNSYFEGPAHYQIRIRNCDNVLIENNEIAGTYVTDQSGYLASTGIFIDNGQKGSYPERELQWLVIQNNYIHDYTTDAGLNLNQDAVALTSPGDGIMFNNTIENWKPGKQADACYDIGHRHQDVDFYQNKNFRIERNVFNNCLVKTPGTDNASNKLIFANNVYFNTYVGDYHEYYEVYRFNETFVYDGNDVLNTGNVFYKLWGPPNGKTYLGNILVYSANTALANIYYQSGNAQADGYQSMLVTDYNYFVVDSPTFNWLGGINIITDFSQWQGVERDVNSQCLTSADCLADLGSGNYELTATCTAKNTGFSGYLKYVDHDAFVISKDFYGNIRSATQPSIGAFE